MNEYRWPVIAVAAIVVLALFFGFNYYRQHYLYQERFLEKLQEMEAIKVLPLKKKTALQCWKSSRGRLPGQPEENDGRNRAIAAAYGHADQAVKLVDRRNQVLDSFAAAASPALYEGPPEQLPLWRLPSMNWRKLTGWKMSPSWSIPAISTCRRGTGTTICIRLSP